MKASSSERLLARWRRAKERRSAWESHWQECYDFALPHRDGPLGNGRPGEKRADRLFDGTAPDAVDQLAASLLAQLTPPWARWFGFAPGPETTPEDRAILAPELERAAATLQTHFDRSNFAVEMHQGFLDLVTAGTASLLFEEAPPGEESAFRFTAVPLSQAAFEEGGNGRLDTTFRRFELTANEAAKRYPGATFPRQIGTATSGSDEPRVALIEAVLPADDGGYSYVAIADPESAATIDAAVLAEGRFSVSPFINFRWLKAPGEIYGRSPVMKALPDIKTANKVVELVLKNASIAATGIWQADDDGVLNPATVKLVPGTIIPKAVGSAGLMPLQAPGRFDVSEIVLTELRQRIRQALLADRLGPPQGPRMTATEVLERAAEMTRVLGATYGRLQSELLTPLVVRALGILARRGEVPSLPLDGRMVVLESKSPLARHQAQRDAHSVLTWLDAVRTLGPEALATVDQAAAARWLARAFGVPGELVREGPSEAEAIGAMLALAAGGNPGEAGRG